MNPPELFTEAQKLLDEFSELSFYSGAEKHKAYRKLLEKTRRTYGEGGVRYITSLHALQSQRQVHLTQKNTVKKKVVHMNNNSINNSGTMAGVSAGGSVWANNITAITQTISDNKSMDADVRSALQGVLADIEKAKLDDDQKEDATTMASRIAKQFDGQAKPDAGIVYRSLEGIQRILGALGTVVSLSTAIAKIFGIGATAAGS